MTRRRFSHIPHPLPIYTQICTHTSHVQDVCYDSNVRVSLTKVLKPDQLVVVIFLTNQKQSQQSGVTLSIEPPSNMKVSTDVTTANDHMTSCDMTSHGITALQAYTASGETDLTLYTDIPGFGNVRAVCSASYVA